MLSLLALRNVIRGLPRLAPIISIIALVLAATLIGNAVLLSSNDALHAVYVRSITADLAVAAESENSFTIFGSDQLLIGDLTVAPTVGDSGETRRLLEAAPEVRAVAGVVTAAAIMNIAGSRRPATLLGVDFADYRDVLPSQRPVAGRFPGPQEPGILLQEHWTTAQIGDSVQLTSGTGQTFTIREVPITGFVRYPIRDQQIDALALVDAETARALNGYIYGAVGQTDLTEDTRLLLDTGIESLFENSASEPRGSDSNETIDLAALLSDSGAAEQERDALRARQTLPSAWNFMLVSLHEPRDAGRAARNLRRRGITASGNQVRRWWQTAGGTAGIVHTLRTVFNAGLVVVALGAAIVSSNAVVLSILERRGQLGTMRALGSSKIAIALLVCRETLIIVGASAVLGISLGAIGVSAINTASIVPRNQYLSMLFGGGSVGARVSGGMIAAHILGALVVGVFAAAHPIREAVRVHPREAMTA